MKNLSLVIFAWLFSSLTWACSFVQMTEDFKIIEGDGEAPESPNFEVSSIHRGSDDGNYASCSDAGILTLKLLSKSMPNVGYLFSIEKGKYDVGLFPDEPIVTSKQFFLSGEYNFIWLDGNSNEQEPIDIVVRIVAVSESGKKSEPTFLTINHPGVSVPWWKFWK